ncbi:MAG: iron ABC transporter permease [Gammaproteobacteria bacterium]|nr:MAG: iron ABC transporter permease [Gammaproteobacteria bacterium]
MKFSLWEIAVTAIALVLAIPVFVILANVFVPAGDVWQHLYSTVLSDYISNSLLLMLGVTIGSFLLGVTAAWLVSMTEFPGRKHFEWALLLPMAIPAYIIAYTYTGMLDFAGPLQTSLREISGWGYGDYWFPEVRSLSGAAIMMTLVFYPYVYLLARAAFLSQSLCVLEVSRSLGNGPWRTFFTVALPLARPAIIAGLSLVLMETLADYGTVQYFGVSTFTTGIFRTWYGLDNAPAAAQLAAILLLFVLVLLTLERYSRRKARYHNTSRSQHTLGRFRLKGWNKFAAILICFSMLLFGFLLPAAQLAVWAIDTATDVIDERFISLVLHSLGLAASAAILALIISLTLAYGRRLNPTPLIKSLVRISSMGYAVPGTVIAIGVIIPLGYLDNLIDSWMRTHFDYSTGLIFSGTIFALLFAYMARFLAVSLHAVESGMERITPSMDEAARSLGCRPAGILRKIHIPMLKSSVLTAVLLVFVDVLKELPATLILRPFNFNTLAVKVYELAADERLADSSSAALAIVLVGIVPVIILNRSISGFTQRSRSRHEDPA